MFETAQIDTQEDLLKEYHNKVEKLLEGLPEAQKKIVAYSKVLGNVLIGFVPGSSLMSAIKDFMDARKVHKKIDELSGDLGNIEQTESFQEMLQAQKKLKQEIGKLKIRQNELDVLKTVVAEERSKIEELVELNGKEKLTDGALLNALLSDFKTYNEQLMKLGVESNKVKFGSTFSKTPKKFLFPLLRVEIKKEQEFVDFLQKISEQDHRVEYELNLFLKEFLPQLKQVRNERANLFTKVVHNDMNMVCTVPSDFIDKEWGQVLNQVKNEENICAGLIRLFTKHLNDLIYFKKRLEKHETEWDDNRYWLTESSNVSKYETEFNYILNKYVEYATGILNNLHNKLSAGFESRAA